MQDAPAGTRFQSKFIWFPPCMASCKCILFWQAQFVDQLNELPLEQSKDTAV